MRPRTKPKDDIEEQKYGNADESNKRKDFQSLDDIKQPEDERTTRGKRSLDHFHERAYTNLLAKTRLYDCIKAGELDKLDVVQRDNLLLNTEKDKTDILWQQRDEEEMVEIEDEFGRTRLVPRTEIHYADHDNDGEEGPVRRPRNLIRGNHIQTDHFQLDEAAAQRLRQLADNPDQAAADAATHFDPGWEIRTKGTGYYQFETADESLRASQMESLRAFRRETKRAQADEDAIHPSFTRTTSEPSENTDQVRTDGTSSSVIYERKINERKKYLEKLRNDKIRHMNSFVKGSDL